jgi:molecular chaperone DnaJ
MNYQETTEYLFNSTPVFEKIGAKAYKPGLQTTFALDNHGMVVTVPGKGGAGKHNGVNGDLQVIVRVEKNENFERKDKDLYYNLVLDFSTAVLGGEVEIPTLEGKTTIKIEPGTQPGKQVRLRGKGMPAIQGYGYGKGDIIVNITVYIPKTLNKEEKELVKKFKECENFQADKATKKSLFDSIKNLFNK